MEIDSWRQIITMMEAELAQVQQEGGAERATLDDKIHGLEVRWAAGGMMARVGCWLQAGGRGERENESR